MNGEEPVIGILIWRRIADRSRMNANVVTFNSGNEGSVSSNRPAFDVGLKKIRVILQEARVVLLAPRPLRNLRHRSGRQC